MELYLYGIVSVAMELFLVSVAIVRHLVIYLLHFMCLEAHKLADQYQMIEVLMLLLVCMRLPKQVAPGCVWLHWCR